MKITKVTKNTSKAAASILTAYWKTRGMAYSQRWAEAYVTKGHGEDIRKDKFFVLKDKCEVIACVAIVIYEGDVAELRDFVVKLDRRKQGFGQIILKDALEFCKKQKVRKVYSLTNPRQQDFLGKRGFHMEGTLRSHFKKGEDLIIMSRFLKK